MDYIKRAVNLMPAFMGGTVQDNADPSGVTRSIHYDNTDSSINIDGAPSIFTNSTDFISRGQGVLIVSGDIPTAIGVSPWVMSG